MVNRGQRSFDDLISDFEPDLIGAARRLRAIVFEVDPHTYEVVRFGSRAATYGLGPHETSEGYLYIRPYRRWVSLGFYQGANLPDPEHLLEGSEAVMRHVKVSTFDSSGEPATRTLIEEAVAERRRAFGV